MWFDQTIRPLETAYGASAHKEAPEWYVHVINLIEEIADCAAAGKKKLEKGKAAAKQKLAQAKKAQVKKPQGEKVQGEKLGEEPKADETITASTDENSLEHYVADAMKVAESPSSESPKRRRGRQ